MAYHYLSEWLSGERIQSPFDWREGARICERQKRAGNLLSEPYYNVVNSSAKEKSRILDNMGLCEELPTQRSYTYGEMGFLVQGCSEDDIVVSSGVYQGQACKSYNSHYLERDRYTSTLKLENHNSDHGSTETSSILVALFQKYRFRGNPI